MHAASLPRAALKSALASVLPAVQRRNTVPILTYVRLATLDGAVVITGTDLDREVSAIVPGASAGDDFDVTLPAHALSDLEKRAPDGYVAISEIGETSAALTIGALRASLPVLPVADFPALEWRGPVHADFTVKTSDFRDALTRSAFAISTEETRYYLNGVFMHEDAGAVRFVATDGHRMAIRDIDQEGGAPLASADGGAVPGVIIPRETITHLLKLVKGKSTPASVRIVVNTTKARFEVGNVTVVTKLIDGTFPDYARVIPRCDKVARFNVAEFKAAVESVRAVSDDAIKLAFSEGKIAFEARNQFGAMATASASYADKENERAEGAEIGFNSNYLIHALDAIGADEAYIRFSDHASPAIFSAAKYGDGDICIIMPKRV